MELGGGMFHSRDIPLETDRATDPLGMETRWNLRCRCGSVFKAPFRIPASANSEKAKTWSWIRRS